MRLVFFVLSIVSFQNSFSTICEDGLECPDKYTCCQGVSRTSCCPLENAVCCEDKYHCCPNGYKCNIEKKVCEKATSTGNFNISELYELIPANLNYKKGWNALYYNCFNDLMMIKDELMSILKHVIKGDTESISKAKEEFYKLIKDSKITSKDCINFFNEVFGDYRFWE
jgi:hypothetical protein